MRVSTARAIKESGFVPVPVIAPAPVEAMLREYLDALQAAGASGSALVVAGDPAQPRGPYPDAASVIGSGALEQYGVRQVSGISLPVRVWVPGPASVRLLLWYASRCGVAVSAPAARDYGFPLAGPTGTAAPGRFLRALASGYDRRCTAR